MKRFAWCAVLASIVSSSAPTVLGFCGFYISKADTKLFNKASQVVLVRDGDRTVMTMVNDYKGDLKEFAVVIPVPTFLKREQIHVGEKKLRRSPRRVFGAATGRVLTIPTHAA